MPGRSGAARPGPASYQLCQVDVDQELYGPTSTGPVVVTTCQGSASKLLGRRQIYESVATVGLLPTLHCCHKTHNLSESCQKHGVIIRRR